jgi:Methane oxygenase PmoA
MKYTATGLSFFLCLNTSFAQENELVKLVPYPGEKKVDVFIAGRPFTTFLYTDSIEKPVLYPIHAANGTTVTRGFPFNTQPGDPTDHPHHLGLWLNFENVNGLDFWNNSYAIPKEKKPSYGWVKTEKVLKISGGKTGILGYQANWTNHEGDVLLEETTRFEFTGTRHRRIIDRITVLKATTTVLFTDAKDGLLGLRLAHALEMPSTKDQKFTDDKGNATIVKGGTDTIPNGNYLTSEGKQGNDAWSTRGRWCKVYGRMGQDSISIAIIDHPKNPNYPTFWHARGYGLFAANPLGEKIFTNERSSKNLQLTKGQSVTFRFRVIIDEGNTTPSPATLDLSADQFAKKY